MIEMAAHCEHCEILAADVRELRGTVENLAVEVASLRTTVEGVCTTLLGNGQPGRCAAHGESIAKLERWRSWLTGALAVVGLLWGATVTIFAAIIAEKVK